MICRLSLDNGFNRLSLGVFLVSCLLLAISYDTTFAFDRPVASVVLDCFLVALALLVLGTFVYRATEDNPGSHQYSAIPLTEISNVLVTGSAAAVDASNGKKPLKRTWIVLSLLVGVACLRIEIYRRMTLDIECAPAGYAYSIPFLISLYDYWRNQTAELEPVDESLELDESLAIRYRNIATIRRWIEVWILRSRQRYVIAGALILLGGLLSSSFYTGLQSSYICPIVRGPTQNLRTLGFSRPFLDTIILIGAAEVSRSGRQSVEGSKKHFTLLWGYAFLAVGTIWALIGPIISFYGVKQPLIFLNDARYYRSAIGQGLLILLLVTSASQIIPQYNVLGLSFLASFIGIYVSMMTTLMQSDHGLPLVRPIYALMTLIALFLGLDLFSFARAVSGEGKFRLFQTHIRARLSVLMLFFLGIVVVFRQRNTIHFHPIDLLIYNARINYNSWIAQANGSSNLEMAVMEYRRRYNQHPPPGFDRWYEYATSRSSMVIDDFDQIYRDLLPFRALSPARLRELTSQIAINNSNDVGAVIIRNGTARVQEGVTPTHAWMVAGAVEMIKQFSEYLPDMDIVLNLNDEPRIAVPWEKMSAMRATAKAQVLPSREKLTNEWSIDRHLGWAPVEPVDEISGSIFVDGSWKGTFDRYASLICEPSSTARSRRIWDRRHVCLGCIQPHSHGQFLEDWQLASDICHQPDLVSLHGFFLSPAAFKVSQHLIPVFSQSSVPGFGDILYPSPWNYVDKVKYEPSEEFPDMEYSDKTNALFWAGSTSEGISNHREWQGMVRQRFAHLINNNTMGSVSVLLPTGIDSYSYRIMNGSAPSQRLGLSASVQVSDPIVRCGDCDLQTEEFKPATWIDFQKHWQYRYLFDLDGAGFSGRFLPFLQSRSLPFKSALFRQWLDSRITPWLHFVPVDLRLHGVWSTLAYFAGVTVADAGSELGLKVLMQSHDSEGSWIAEEGRKWASQALRKEDMEIYFFRLLLEWGRLTDDRRDLLGFKI